MMIASREAVRATVDKALSEAPQACLLEAAEAAAVRLALPLEAVLDALAVEEAT